MKPKIGGIVLIAIGILMLVMTGFNYMTTEKVVDIGPVEIQKEKSHSVEWPPIIGVLLIVGGGALLVLRGKKASQ